MDMSFQLCSRCKKMASWGRSQLTNVTLGSRIHGSCCDGCMKHIAEKVDEMMNEIPIPEALQPYLLRPDPPKTENCPACAGIEGDRHIDGCPMKNFLQG